MTPRVCHGYLAGMLAMTVIYMVGPGPLHSGLMFNAIGASAIGAILVGTRVNRPRVRLPWYLFALGQALFVCGDLIAYNWESVVGRPLPYPSVADGLYLLVYPVAIAGLLILIHQRNPARDRASLLDSLILATGAGVLSWVLVIAPYAHDETLSLATKLTSVAYPVMDLLAIGVAVRFAMDGGRRGLSFALLVGGAIALFVTDSIFGFKLLHGGYEPGGFLDPGWVAFYALWGAAALHPSMRRLSDPAREPDWRLTPRRLGLLAAATLIAPGVLLIHGQSTDTHVVAGASLVLFTLVVARMAGLVKQHEEAVRREKALRRAGAALVSAAGAHDIRAAALDAARTLAGQSRTPVLYLLDDAQSEFCLPEDVRERLLPGEATEADLPELGRCDLAPLFSREELRGVLAVEGDALSRPVTDAMLALAANAALALESAELTQGLARQESEARFRTLFQHSSDVVTVVGADMRVMYLSPAITRVFGYAPEDVVGARFGDLVHQEDYARVLTFLGGLTGQPADHAGVIEFRMRHHDGSWLHVETHGTNLLHDSSVAGMVLNSRDVSERKAFEEQLTHQALHDTLTGLPNRALFQNRVEHALERQRRGEPGLAVLFLDLDDFKTVNDSLGHVAGDALLREVGSRVTGSIRGADTAARLGGDEFAVLIDGVHNELQVAEVADRIDAALGVPFLCGGKEIAPTASIGIAFGDADGRGRMAVEDLLRNADVAMYMAKDAGKGRSQIFDPKMHTAAIERLGLKADLQRAVRDREFLLNYQPIIDLQTERMSGVEALVRWQHPDRGLIPPGDFIPLAEETGMIVEIGAFVLQEACREAVELQMLCPQEPPLTMSVNLSARQLQRADIADDVKQALDSSGLAPGHLVLEITESMMMADIDLAVIRLEALHNLGVRLAIDDFGTGYSSLNAVRQFPFDVLKVDKSFIDDLGESDEVSSLTAAIIDIACVLNLSPVAEGIETADQLAILRGLNCRFGQGYLFHRPLDKEHIETLAARQGLDSGVNGAGARVRCERGDRELERLLDLGL